MYAAGPNQSSSAKAQELEDYLLGKKRIDSLIEQGTSIDKVYLILFTLFKFIYFKCNLLI